MGGWSRSWTGGVWSTAPPSPAPAAARSPFAIAPPRRAGGVGERQRNANTRLHLIPPSRPRLQKRRRAQREGESAAHVDKRAEPHLLILLTALSPYLLSRAYTPRPTAARVTQTLSCCGTPRLNPSSLRPSPTTSSLTQPRRIVAALSSRFTARSTRISRALPRSQPLLAPRVAAASRIRCFSYSTQNQQHQSLDEMAPKGELPPAPTAAADGGPIQLENVSVRRVHEAGTLCRKYG